MASWETFSTAAPTPRKPDSWLSGYIGKPSDLDSCPGRKPPGARLRFNSFRAQRRNFLRQVGSSSTPIDG